MRCDYHLLKLRTTSSQQYELVSYDEEKRVFRATTKGKRFLKLYNEMSELAPRRRI
jgi:predicted transcriptional regulator